MDHENLIQRTLDYIEDNLTTEIELSELAGAAGYSCSHFARIFKKMTGLTVSKYLNRRRLMHAAYAISRGMPVTEAAFTYGFDTKSGFYKAFVREFGTSPTGYIERHSLRPPHPVRLSQEEHIMMTKKQVEKLLLTHWGIDAPVTDFYWPGPGIRADDVWNVGDDCCLKANGNIPAELKAASVAAKTVEAGMPSEAPVPTLSGELLVQEGELGFILYRKSGEPFLSKEMIGDPASAKKAGRQVAGLARILASAEGIDCPETDLYSHLKDWAVPTVREKGDMDGAFWSWYLQMLDTLMPLLPVQMIHRDPNASNLLKSGGFRGFEMVQKNVRLFDPCYAATSVLSETWTDPAARESWFDILQGILKGYDAENPLTAEEKKAVPLMVFSIQLICVAFFGGSERFRELYETNLGMLKFLSENKEKLCL